MREDFLISVNDLDGEVPMQPTISDSIQSRTREDVKQCKATENMQMQTEEHRAASKCVKKYHL